MTGESGEIRDARLDAQMIDELRRTRDQLRAPSDGTPWLMKVTLEEVDALLAAVDERDALRREVCGDPTPPFPPVSVTAAASLLAPAFTGSINAAAAREDALGREARETPPTAYQWRATGTAWGGDRMGAEAAMRHYARMHGGKVQRRTAAGPWVDA